VSYGIRNELTMLDNLIDDNFFNEGLTNFNEERRRLSETMKRYNAQYFTFVVIIESITQQWK
jgi:hypothetical protein